MSLTSRAGRRRAGDAPAWRSPAGKSCPCLCGYPARRRGQPMAASDLGPVAGVVTSPHDGASDLAAREQPRQSNDETRGAAGRRPAARRARRRTAIMEAGYLPTPTPVEERTRERQRHRLLLRDPRRGRAATRAARRAGLERPVRTEPGPARRRPSGDRRRPARPRAHAPGRPADQPDRHGRRHGGDAPAARLPPGRRASATRWAAASPSASRCSTPRWCGAWCWSRPASARTASTPRCCAQQAQVSGAVAEG